MDLIEAIVSRRSVGRLTEPAPTDDELTALLEHAVTAPDHGLLRPWRLIIVRDDARRLLGEAFVTASDDERAAAKPMRAPLLVSIVFSPRPSPKVPEWEQLAAVSAMVQNLCLLLHIKGWGSIWRSGAVTDAPPVRAVLDLRATEQLLGWLYVGTPEPVQQARHRPLALADVRARISTLDEKGVLRCA
jgi:nitroreductase